MTRSSNTREDRKFAHRARRKTSENQFTAFRIGDLNRLLSARYGAELPDDDAGRDDALIVCHHLARLSGDPRKRIPSWLRLRAPWLSLLEAEAILVECITKPRQWRADTLAWRLHLTEAERRALHITTIGAIDLTAAERSKARAERNRLAKLAARRRKGAQARAKYLEAAKGQKPWIAAGCSRATWFRRRRETGFGYSI